MLSSCFPSDIVKKKKSQKCDKVTTNHDWKKKTQQSHQQTNPGFPLNIQVW